MITSTLVQSISPAKFFKGNCIRGLFLSLIALISACGPADNEETAVVEMFKSYQSSLLQDDGRTAVDFLSDRTVRYYSGLVAKARSMPEDTLRKESFLDRFTVLRLRDEIEPGQLSTMTGKELLIYAIEQSWIDKEAVAEYEVQKITLKDDFAAIRLTKGDVEVAFPFEAYKEDGRWALDLTPGFRLTNLWFVQQAEEAGLTEDEFIDRILIGLGSSEGLTDTLWMPSEAQ